MPEIILDSSMVEHSAVNRVVVGSSPTRGVEENSVNIMFIEFCFIAGVWLMNKYCNVCCLYRESADRRG